MSNIWFTRGSGLPPNLRFGDIVISDSLRALAIARPDGNTPFYLHSASQTNIAFIFTQSSPSTEWVVNHNLGYKPIVEVLDTFGQIITYGVEIFNVSENQLRVISTPAVSGSIRCI